jgi:hypothetical protein
MASARSTKTGPLKRVTLRAVNDELVRRGHNAMLAKAEGYFYFRNGEAADWLDRTVNVSTLSALTLEQWMDEFERLRKLNQQIMRKPAKTAGRKSR